MKTVIEIDQVVCGLCGRRLSGTLSVYIARHSRSERVRSGRSTFIVCQTVCWRTSSHCVHSRRSSLNKKNVTVVYALIRSRRIGLRYTLLLCSRYFICPEFFSTTGRQRTKYVRSVSDSSARAMSSAVRFTCLLFASIRDRGTFDC